MKILYLPHQYSQQRQHEKRRWIYPVHLAMEAEWYRRQGHEVIWDNPLYGEIHNCKIVTEPENIPFLDLPAPDRIFTNAFDKKYQQNGNFKYHPATYIQVANGCWHGRCSFCVERNNKWEVRPIESVIEELKELERFNFKEVFDDSGTFPVGSFLDSFIRVLNIHKFHFRFGCNFRMVDADYRAMRMAGFRMLLFGLESANQQTLDLINKGTKVEDVKYIISAAKLGLDCHVACMFGFSNETDEDAIRTLRLMHYLLRKGYAKTAQASFYMPPDGKNNPSHRKYVRKLYDVAWYPSFWLNKLRDIHDVDDLKYLWRQIKEGLNGISSGNIFDNPNIRG